MLITLSVIFVFIYTYNYEFEMKNFVMLIRTKCLDEIVNRLQCFNLKFEFDRETGYLIYRKTNSE